MTINTSAAAKISALGSSFSKTLKSAVPPKPSTTRQIAAPRMIMIETNLDHFVVSARLEEDSWSTYRSNRVSCCCSIYKQVKLVNWGYGYLKIINSNAE